MCWVSWGPLDTPAIATSTHEPTYRGSAGRQRLCAYFMQVGVLPDYRTIDSGTDFQRASGVDSQPSSTLGTFGGEPGPNSTSTSRPSILLRLARPRSLDIAATLPTRDVLLPSYPWRDEARGLQELHPVRAGVAHDAAFLRCARLETGGHHRFGCADRAMASVRPTAHPAK
jgi:hypothetical protein